MGADVNRIRGWLSITRLIDLFLVAFVAVVVGTAAMDALLPVSGHPVVIITGRSMAPTIAIGSVVVEEPNVVASLRPGDVATFAIPSGGRITHRVTRVVERADGTWYETKGDANGTADPTLQPSSTALGRVLFSVPLLGYLIWLLHLPSGILAVVTAALALYVAGLLAEDRDDEEPEPESESGRAGGSFGVPA